MVVSIGWLKSSHRKWHFVDLLTLPKHVPARTIKTPPSDAEPDWDAGRWVGWPAAKSQDFLANIFWCSKMFLDVLSDKPFVQNNFHLNPICHGCLPCLFCCYLKLIFDGRVTLSQVAVRANKRPEKHDVPEGQHWHKQWRKYPKTACGWRSIAISDWGNVYPFNIETCWLLWYQM